MVDWNTTFQHIAGGFQMILSWETWVAVMLGLLVGLPIGAIPGLSSSIGLALFAPFTFFLPPLIGLPFLVGIYKGADIGGFVPAILFNVPGTPSTAATLMDGYPLARKGYPNKALQASLWASVSADAMSDVLLLFSAPFLGIIALGLGPADRFALIFLALVVIALYLGASPVKGAASAAFGLLLSTVGVDAISGVRRFTFGSLALSDGFDIVPVLLGVFAVAECMRLMGRRREEAKDMEAVADLRAGLRPDDHLTLREFWSMRRTLFRATAIGSAIGAAPGLGPTAAGFLSWTAARGLSKDPDSFGKGNVEGIVAAEAANSAVNGPNLIPLLALGIPGSLSAAILYSAFIAQGLHPGPALLRESGTVLYGFLFAMIGANVFMFLFGVLFMRSMAHVMRVPYNILVPAILIMATAGAFSARNSWLDVWVMMGFGIIGYAMDRAGFPIVPFIIAFVLGRPFEDSLLQSLLMFQGNILGFFRYPVSGISLAVSVGLVAWRSWRVWTKRRMLRQAEVSPSA